MRRALFSSLPLFIFASSAFAQLAPLPPAQPKDDAFFAVFARFQVVQRSEYYTGIARNLFAVRSDAPSEIQLTMDNHSYVPALAPNGSDLAYFHLDPVNGFDLLDGGLPQLFRSESDGKNPRLVTTLPSQSLSMSWSPDSKSLLFMAVPQDPSMPANLLLLRAAPGSVPLYLGQSLISEIEWSPDSKWAAFLCPSSSKHVHPQLCAVRPSTPKTFHVVSNLAIGRYSWSPDGSSIAFTAGSKKVANIYVAAMDSPAPVSIAAIHYPQSSLSWSPDGKQLLFTDRDGGRTAVFRINADGSSRLRLTDPKLDAADPEWLPDASHVAFSANVAKKRLVHLMNPDGSHVRSIQADNYRQCQTLTWLPRTSLLFILCGNTFKKSVFARGAYLQRHGRGLLLVNVAEPSLSSRLLASGIDGDVAVGSLPPSGFSRTLDFLPPEQ